MGRDSLEDIIARAAQILDVDARTLDEGTARETLRNIAIRNDNARIRKARDDVTKKQTS